MSASRKVKRPTRRDLLCVIARLQSLAGDASAAIQNDRSLDRARDVDRSLKEALSLCLLATGSDDPVQPDEELRALSRLRGAA